MQLLFNNDRVEEAENALQKAFAINPNYPFGHYLRAMFRYYEGEITGALLLFRKAAELYDPEALAVLANVYAIIADCEMSANNPMAARFAMRTCLHMRPSDDELAKKFQEIFGDQSHVPLPARREYVFRSPGGSAVQERRRAWDTALKGTATGRLTDAFHAFEKLTAADPEDAAAWYNLGLCLGWLGDNRRALEALDRYVTLETDESQAAAAWTLAEVLRRSQGLEELADYREYAMTFPIRNGATVVSLLNHWQSANRLMVIQSNKEDGLIFGMVIDQPPVITVGSSGGQTARLGGYFLYVPGSLRLWNSVKEALKGLRQEIWQQAGQALSQPHESVGAVRFTDVVTEALVFPVGPMPEQEVTNRIRGAAERYFEEIWIHRPLRSLNSIPPIDAAGSVTLRKKLLGVIQFLQECSVNTVVQLYDFNRLRRKLGLVDGEGEGSGGEGTRGLTPGGSPGATPGETGKGERGGKRRGRNPRAYARRLAGSCRRQHPRHGSGGVE